MKSYQIYAITTLSAVSVLLTSSTLGGFASAIAAPWLAPAASDELSSGWVKEIGSELRSPKYNQIFINLSTPLQPAMLHLLNAAADALKENNPGYAKDLVNQVDSATR